MVLMVSHFLIETPYVFFSFDNVHNISQKLFALCLNYLRSGKWHIPKKAKNLAEIEAEIKFYGLYDVYLQTVNSKWKQEVTRCSIFLDCTYFEDSNILSESMQDLLNNWYGIQDQCWKLIYRYTAFAAYNLWAIRATRDGWRAQDFHYYCNSRGPTMSVVKVSNFVFGGLNPSEWYVCDNFCVVNLLGNPLENICTTQILGSFLYQTLKTFLWRLCSRTEASSFLFTTRQIMDRPSGVATIYVCRLLNGNSNSTEVFRITPTKPPRIILTSDIHSDYPKKCREQAVISPAIVILLQMTSRSSCPKTLRNVCSLIIGLNFKYIISSSTLRSFLSPRHYPESESRSCSTHSTNRATEHAVRSQVHLWVVGSWLAGLKFAFKDGSPGEVYFNSIPQQLDLSARTLRWYERLLDNLLLIRLATLGSLEVTQDAKKNRVSSGQILFVYLRGDG